MKILVTCPPMIKSKEHFIPIFDDLGWEAVIPDFEDVKDSPSIEVSLDALYMIVGREKQRTRSEWKHLIHNSGFNIEEIIRTSSPTCSLVVLSKKHQ